MSSLFLSPERIQSLLRPTDRGVVGLVDDLLELCRDAGLRLDYIAGVCRVCPLGGGSSAATEAALPKSVFRAALARVAVLCNERVPNSVSPYGGEGELLIGANPPTVFLVAFTNTPDEQWLEVRRMSSEEAEIKAYTNTDNGADRLTKILEK
jgi:hypothetical protein